MVLLNLNMYIFNVIYYVENDKKHMIFLGISYFLQWVLWVTTYIKSLDHNIKWMNPGP